MMLGEQPTDEDSKDEIGGSRLDQVRHSHWLRHVRIGKQKRSVHHHGEQQSERESGFGPLPFQHPNYRQRQSDPTNRPHDLKWNKPGSISKHDSHLGQETSWINAAVILRHARMSPRDEIAEGEIENYIDNCYHNEFPGPFARGNDQPRTWWLVAYLRLSLSENQNRQHG